MSAAPSLEKKIIELQERLHRPRCPENIPNSRSGGAGDMSATAGPSVSGPGRPSPSPSPSRPRMLPIGSSTRPRPRNLQVPQPLPQQTTQEDDSRWQEIIKRSGLLKINSLEYRTQINDLEHLGELGNGTCGHVVRMLHKPSSAVIAVKQMRRSGNSDENKRITMDIEVVLKSDDCPFIVQCVGCFILEADVWICMELMDTCFDKLLKKLRRPIPEFILGKVTVATVKALHYLKETHGVIHRDVKPSNILLDQRGNVKLCDFGISGRLVDSKAQTRSAGCAAYMAPERIDPPDPTKPDYDIRADVWSLGITLVELATGVFPYSNCHTDFEVLSKVLTSDPPKLPADQDFSLEFRDFVNCCLTKDYKNRPKYRKLLDHAFITKYETEEVDVAEWYANAVKESESNKPTSTVPSRTANPTSTSQGTINQPIINDTPSSASSPMQRPSATPPSPTVRRNAPLHYPQHMRSMSETGRLFHQTGQCPPLPSHVSSHAHPVHQIYSNHPNGDALSSSGNGRWASSSIDALGGRSSPLHSSRMPTATEAGGREREMRDVNALRSTPPTMSPAHAFWQAQEARAAEWDSSRISVGPGFINSPVPGRKRFPSEPPQPIYREQFHSGNTSPLVLQRFYHQQQQIQQQHHHHLYHHHHHHPSLNSYPQSVSPNRHLPRDIESVDNPKTEEQSSSGKKRFTSILKFSLGGCSSANNSNSPSSPGSPNSSSRLPPPRPTRHASPGPPPPSPDPPPRLSRRGLSDGTPSASPLAGRRGFLDSSPVRRSVLDGSPSLPRRYVSPSPPQPPPRRLSTEGGPNSLGSSGYNQSGLSGTSSVPGSPQVRRFDSLRARFHYTPQPQRRVFGASTDFHDL